jgi:hypothetical protein
VVTNTTAWAIGTSDANIAASAILARIGPFITTLLAAWLITDMSFYW